MSHLESLKAKIAAGQAHCAVIGLGYVGLPLAVEFAKSGIPAQRFRGSGGLGLDRETVQVLEITKLTERSSGPLTVHVDSFEGNNLVFVDEGHRGSSGETPTARGCAGAAILGSEWAWITSAAPIRPPGPVPPIILRSRLNSRAKARAFRTVAPSSLIPSLAFAEEYAGAVIDEDQYDQKSEIIAGQSRYGIGTAARAYFSRPAAELSLAEAAALAAMIQGPNRLSPIDDAAALRGRRDWVLSRMEELGWATAAEVAQAKAAAVTPRPSPPRTRAPVHLLGWVREEVEGAARGRAEQGRGFLVETTVDPYLQELAEQAVDGVLPAVFEKSFKGFPAVTEVIDPGAERRPG